MKSKDKGTIIIISVIMIWTSILLICYFCFHKPISYATNGEEAVQISNATLVDISQIIEENTHISTKEEILKEVA